jgi:selenocysteine lyase/cysteine desulfurase
MNLDLAALLRSSEIGRASAIETPFGRRLLCYADMTASGRFLDVIEGWMARLKPYYANSHTVISTTGTLMTNLREQAREIVRRSVGARADDVVLFVGSGATKAVNKLVGLLGLSRPARELSGWCLDNLPPERRPLVLVGPYEHHSNELPWFESLAEVVQVGETPRGEVCLDDLARKLERGRGRPLVIGSFSAASNVTGILTDVHAIARVLHAHGALAFFDFAACAPYVPIDMHPAGDDAARLDAVFISTHKFAGGPNATAVLVCAKSCVRKAVPDRPGGGTVDYVSYFGRHNIDYVGRLEEREEGGTPAIISDVRAGAAFLLRELMEPETLRDAETALARRAIARLARHPRIRLLGPSELPRLPILSFIVDGLHHDFVSTLLDHLFGIQNRAGCACAGPYGHRLLGVGPETSLAIREWVLRGVLGIKPGWTRVTLSPYATEEDVEFVLSAIELVASDGDAFLPEYQLGWRDGVWTHRRHTPGPAPFEISLASMRAAAPGTIAAPALGDQELARERARYFDEARAHVARLRREHPAPPATPTTGIAALDRLVWFKYVHATAVPTAEEAALSGPPLASD